MVILSFLGCEDCKRKKIDQVFSLAIGRGKSLIKANRWAGGGSSGIGVAVSAVCVGSSDLIFVLLCFCFLF